MVAFFIRTGSDGSGWYVDGYGSAILVPHARQAPAISIILMSDLIRMDFPESSKKTAMLE
jgi:hypothetical protein